ncbi:C45 family autoproteolytic acyltransferase/hydrolase [Halobacteriovorax sp. GB3]|uniref:C45 family autoproteolytic acyltransferase/hydolase n=1 Tax=Halobacteriovorax sp. GB3 TaxID=2719615 RepID=UPI0023622591|nr:C45 family peptidase [Halobacteriovorax sp. GB3]MDD0851595.1 C45 family autoproteolytic acyltransferase/hydrolase [Halobacteriovorax sp. GB3]
MKYIMLLLLSLTFIPLAEGSECQLEKEKFGQKYYRCELEGKSFHMLDIKGNMKELAYYHGYFLAPEIDQGVLRAVLQQRDDTLKTLSSKERAQFQTIYKCMMNRYKRSVGKDFIKELENISMGARDAGYSIRSNDVIEATLMVELSGYVDAMQVEMEENKTKATIGLLKRCGLYFAGNAVKKAVKTITRPFKKLKRGCTGFAASFEITKNGEHLHGRNFDTGLLGVFEKHPVITRHIPRRGHPYVSMSSAGLHYGGGITGMNEKGISISTHELRTTDYRTAYNFKRATTAPYLANKVVKEASSLDEAIAIVKKYGHFGAWTFLISDSKTGESASVEITGAKVRVAKRSKVSMGQSNHFIHKDTAKENFEYSINKSLESRARLSLVERTLREDAGSIDVNWGVELLSGHEDFYVGLRSFGRTVSKVYTSMTHIMDTKNNEFWFSIGNRYPTNLTTFQGMQISFDEDEKFFELINTIEPQTILKEQRPSFISSLENYTMAYFAHERGAYKEAIELLLEGSKLQALESMRDFPTQIMITRLCLKVYATTMEEEYLQCAEETVRDILLNNYEGLHNYEKAQVMMDMAKVFDMQGKRFMAKSFFENAEQFLVGLNQSFKGHHFLGKLNHDLKRYINNGITKTELREEDLHFATAE